MSVSEGTNSSCLTSNLANGCYTSAKVSYLNNEYCTSRPITYSTYLVVFPIQHQKCRNCSFLIYHVQLAISIGGCDDCDMFSPGPTNSSSDSVNRCIINRIVHSSGVKQCLKFGLKLIKRSRSIFWRCEQFYMQAQNYFNTKAQG